IPTGRSEFAIRLPMVAERFPAQQAYDAAVHHIEPVLASGGMVAVLCEGDPLLYGSFMYLLDRFAGRVETGIVPGVSSVMAGAAAACMPLISRTDTLTILPGTLPDAALVPHLRAAEAVAILKLGRHLPRIRALIDRLGLLPPARYVERASLAEQRLTALAVRESGVRG